MQPIEPLRDARPRAQHLATRPELEVAVERAKAQLPRRHVTKHPEDDMAADLTRRPCATPKMSSARAGSTPLAW